MYCKTIVNLKLLIKKSFGSLHELQIKLSLRVSSAFCFRNTGFYWATPRRFLPETIPQYQKGLLKFRIKYCYSDSITSWLLISFLVGTLTNSTTVFACYKTHSTTGPVKENVIHYNGETALKQKTATVSFAFTSVPTRTLFHRCNSQFHLPLHSQGRLPLPKLPWHPV